MKFIRTKITAGREYHYFEYPIKIAGRRCIFSNYLGNALPDDLIKVIDESFDEIAEIVEGGTGKAAKTYFFPKSILPIEQARFWYQGLHHELKQTDLTLFRSLFLILFILNSNRAEGSKVTRKDIEKLIKRKQKPKTQLDLEIINSMTAVDFAFSKKMKWNVKSIKTLHRLLLTGIAPGIAGELKKDNVVVNNEVTSDPKSARKELQSLLVWLKQNKKKLYPPILALNFHYRFEAIHPFEDGNGRVGRLLFNSFLLQNGYMPVVFFSENHTAYSAAISQARLGRKRKLAHYFIGQLIKTRKAISQYKAEEIIKGGSSQVGKWEIERGKIRKF